MLVLLLSACLATAGFTLVLVWMKWRKAAAKLGAYRRHVTDPAMRAWLLEYEAWVNGNETFPLRPSPDGIHPGDEGIPEEVRAW